MHNYYVDKAKYKDLFELNQEDRMSAEKSIIDKRTDTLHEITYTLYFIESNLLYERKNKEPCDMNAFLELSAYAHWVALLLEDANILYRTSDLVHIVVNDDLTIDSETINNPEYAAYNKRTYDYQGYGIGDKDADNLFIGKVVSTLEAELNIDFQTFIDFMNYLQVYAAKKSVPLEKNVYQIKINDLLQDFMQKVSFEASYEGVVSCIKVLSINTKDLLIKGKNGSSFLPIGRRKDRANRFEIKPLLIVGDSIIYSPVHINYVHKRWVDGLLDWYPPYEKGISNTVKVLDEWKRHYESKMVLDLKKVFDDCKYNYVMTNYTVKNPNIYGDYPTDIGDYDVIAINNTKHEVWIIECKVIKKVGSFNEMYDQQNNFFKNKRYVEKFELRIDFMKKNYKTLLANKCDRNYEYTVVSKMCINKVFSSQFKQIGIDIVSFDELVKSIKQEK